MNLFRRLLATDNTISTFCLRLALGIVFFPHGAGKMFPVFGGEGFSATLHGMSRGMDIPVILVFLAIVAEFFGSIALVFGFLTRVAACGITAVMLVALALVHARAGFFMNWTSQAGKTEGFEYHLLVLGICIALILRGGGAWSIDRFLVKNTAEQETRIPPQS